MQELDFFFFFFGRIFARILPSYAGLDGDLGRARRQALWGMNSERQKASCTHEASATTTRDVILIKARYAFELREIWLCRRIFGPPSVVHCVEGISKPDKKCGARSSGMLGAEDSDSSSSVQLMHIQACIRCYC
jgi:hypothetical protein